MFRRKPLRRCQLPKHLAIGSSSDFTPSLGRIFADTITDFRRLPSLDSAVILSMGGLVAAIGHPADVRVSNGFSSSQSMKGPFSAGQTIGAATTQLAGGVRDVLDRSNDGQPEGRGDWRRSRARAVRLASDHAGDQVQRRPHAARRHVAVVPVRSHRRRHSRRRRCCSVISDGRPASRHTASRLMSPRHVFR